MNPIVKFCEYSGLSICRGSGSASPDSSLHSGGVRQAMDALKSQLSDPLVGGGDVLLAVDGPSGPAFKVKKGCVELAKATKRPIVHVWYTCEKGKGDETRWDKMLFPAFFDEINFYYEEPVFVEEDANTENVCEGVIEKKFWEKQELLKKKTT